MMLPEAQIDFLFITPRSVYVIRVNCFQDTSTLITDTETTKLYDIKAGNFLQYSSLTSLINASKPVLVSEFPGNYWEEYMTAIYGICKWKSEFVFFFLFYSWKLSRKLYLCFGCVVGRKSIELWADKISSLNVNNTSFVTFNYEIDSVGFHRIHHELGVRFGAWVYLGREEHDTDFERIGFGCSAGIGYLDNLWQVLNYDGQFALLSRKK